MLTLSDTYIQTHTYTHAHIRVSQLSQAVRSAPSPSLSKLLWRWSHTGSPEGLSSLLGENLLG